MYIFTQFLCKVAIRIVQKRGNCGPLLLTRSLASPHHAYPARLSAVAPKFDAAVSAPLQGVGLADLQSSGCCPREVSLEPPNSFPGNAHLWRDGRRRRRSTCYA